MRFGQIEGADWGRIREQGFRKSGVTGGKGGVSVLPSDSRGRMGPDTTHSKVKRLGVDVSLIRLGIPSAHPIHRVGERRDGEMDGIDGRQSLVEFLWTGDHRSSSVHLASRITDRVPVGTSKGIQERKSQRPSVVVSNTPDPAPTHQFAKRVRIALNRLYSVVRFSIEATLPDAAPRTPEMTLPRRIASR